MKNNNKFAKLTENLPKTLPKVPNNGPKIGDHFFTPTPSTNDGGEICFCKYCVDFKLIYKFYFLGRFSFNTDNKQKVPRDSLRHSAIKKLKKTKELWNKILYWNPSQG